ncbi:MAG TPA: hypothetical protein VKU41_29790 [Polyangiaceae bacterium]|nr:hypothetical protein [Polyangiaceae bacterium]
MENRIFFPQAGLDEWVLSGSVDLQDGELTILPSGHKYKLAEAVHVLREVSGSGDLHELLGRVKARAYLEQLGAEIVESSMLLGDSAYDVEPGWIGIPVGAVPKGGEEAVLRSLGKG